MSLWGLIYTQTLGWTDGSRVKSSGLFFQSARLQFLAPIWQLITAANSSYRGSSVQLLLLASEDTKLTCSAQMDRMQENTHMHKIKHILKVKMKMFWC